MELSSAALMRRLKGWVEDITKWKLFDIAGEPAAGNTFSGFEVDAAETSYDNGALTATIVSKVVTMDAEFDPKHAHLLEGANTDVIDVDGDDITYRLLEDGKKYKLTLVISAGASGEICTCESGSGWFDLIE